MDFELSPSEWRARLTRRSFLSAGVQGVGSVALASLLARDLKAAPNPGGAALGRLGPVTEGLFIWTAGLGALIAVAVWIGAKVK